MSSDKEKNKQTKKDYKSIDFKTISEHEHQRDYTESQNRLKQWGSTILSIWKTTNNHISSHIIEDMALEICVLAWERHKNVVELNRLIGYKPPLLITGSPTAIHIPNVKKPAQIRFHSKRPHTITKMNDNINIDSTIAGSMNDNINIDSTIAGSMNAGSY